MARASLWRRLFFLDQWCIGYAAAGIERFLECPGDVRFTWIRPRSRRMLLADPFGVERGGRLIILAEHLVYGRGRGRLVAIEAKSRQANALLSRAFHLSYPFVVQDGDDTYVVPEQSETRALAFYRLNGMLLDDPVVRLPDMGVIDPTLLHHDGRWWLFGTRRREDANAALHLFHAESLFGPYEPHPKNPVVRDASCARPAGRIIRSGTRLLRPGQDCRERYGAAITICEIDEISPTHYREHVVQRLESRSLQGAFPEGVHTLDHTPGYVLLDSKRRVFHPLAALFKLADWGFKRARVA